MDLKAFTQDTYRTAPKRPGLIARALPSAVFYYHAARIVLAGSRKAKRGLYRTPEWRGSSFDTIRALEQVGCDIEITGMGGFQHVDGPCVFIGNHMSTLETFVLPVVIATTKEATFVVKQSLIDYPVFRYIMRSRNPIVVGRTNAREDLRAVLEGGAERLKAGWSIIIFPQTTRTPNFDPEQFNSIGIKLAKKAGVPVVPIALKTDAWGNGKLLKDFGKIDPAKKVRFAFGEPMAIAGRGDEEHEKIVAFILGKLKEWGK
jgi:1-acyl-sn-glycerol-3-phosphate acyltransferase